MQFTSFTYQGKTGLGIAEGGSIRGVLQGEGGVPVALDQIIGSGASGLAEVGPS